MGSDKDLDKKAKKKTKVPIMRTKKIKAEDPQNSEPEIEKVSTRKVIFIEIDDEITIICDRIRKIPHKKVYIVVPQRALIFQSIVNLKILKRKAIDMGKEVFIITNDVCGTHMSQNVGLNVYNKVDKKDRQIRPLDKHLKIQPIEASINTVQDNSPSRLVTKKMSIGQLVRSLQQKSTASNGKKVAGSTGFVEKLKKTGGKKSKKMKKKKESRFVMVAPNKHAITTLLVVSVLLLLIIVYIAIPSATITLIPKSNQIEEFVNITLADKDINRYELELSPPNTLASYPINVNVTQKVVHHATGSESQGKRSKGVINVINESNQDWSLIKNTRFQTADGLVFRSQNFVTIPAKRGDQPGSLNIEVIADDQDVNGEIIGERGNIGPTKFFVPGLNAENQKVLYAQSSESMTGGQTDLIKLVTKDDLTAVEEKIRRTLEGEAQKALENEVNKINQERNLNLQLLTGKGAIEFGEAQITIPENIEGQRLNEFEIYGEMEANGTAFIASEFRNILQKELNSKKNPQKRLITIDSENISYKIFDFDRSVKKIRITATIKGIEEFDVQPDRENGLRLIEKIKSHVRGKKIEDAENFIQNLPEINDVDIESWPFWSVQVPSFPENIKIVIKRSDN